MQLQLGQTSLQEDPASNKHCLIYIFKHNICTNVSAALHAALCLSSFRRSHCSNEAAWSLSVEQHRRAELEAQMKAREEAKKKDKADRLQEDLKVHRESAMYDRWGKGGGGAPRRSPAGQPISDLHQVGSIVSDLTCHAEVDILHTSTMFSILQFACDRLFILILSCL